MSDQNQAIKDKKSAYLGLSA